MNVDVVRCDSEQAAYDGIQHLLGLGHERIAALCGSKDITSSRDRAAGYRRAMQDAGPFAFWLVVGATFFAIALYAAYRMTQRAVVPVEDTESYLNILPTSTPVAVEAAGEWAVENAESEREQQPD